MVEQQVNVSINEGEAFFAHEASVSFNPTQFVLDFKCITPRIDMRSKNGHQIAMKHNVVLIEPYHVKALVDLLSKMVDAYEKQFCKIEKPKAVKKFEEKHKELIKSSGSEATIVPSYFG